MQKQWVDLLFAAASALGLGCTATRWLRVAGVHPDDWVPCCFSSLGAARGSAAAYLFRVRGEHQFLQLPRSKPQEVVQYMYVLLLPVSAAETPPTHTLFPHIPVMQDDDL